MKKREVSSNPQTDFLDAKLARNSDAFNPCFAAKRSAVVERISIRSWQIYFTEGLALDVRKIGVLRKWRVSPNWQTVQNVLAPHDRQSHLTFTHLPPL